MPFCKGMLRRVLHRVTTGTEAVVSVDSTTGRIVMDIGSAFSRDVYLAAHVTAVPYDEGTIEKEYVCFIEVLNVCRQYVCHFANLLPKRYKYYCVLERNYSDEEFPESEQIQKQFEICSYDEYDDFKPRHPLPKVE